MMPPVTMLRNVPFFTGLSDQELAILAHSISRQTFAKDMIIFHKGSIGQSLYIIASGMVRIFLLSASGQEISVNVYGPGQVFGQMSLLDGLPRAAGAVAMEKTVTLILHRDDLLRHLEACPRLAWSIMAVLNTRLRYMTAYVESLAFLDVYGRVAAKLLELADRYGVCSDDVVEIDLRLTQAELATWVAATRESVNKVLGMFRDQRLIRVEGQKITILDPRGLKNRASY